MAATAVPANKVVASPPRSNLFRDFVLGGIATCFAVTFTNPMDVVKTRLQLQGELMRRGQFVKHYNGVFHGTYVIFKQEGIVALQKGLTAAWMYQIAMNGTRLGSYDALKRLVASQGQGHEKMFFVQVALGAMSGVTGAFVGSPLFLIKTRLQSAGGLVGVQFAYSGFVDAFTSVAKQGGIRGLWSGAGAAMLRTGVGSACQLSTYDLTKAIVMFEFGVPAGIQANVAAALTSGLVLATAMNPFDVISTRLYNQDPKAPVFKGPIDCLIKTWKTEGVLGFFKGWGAHYFRIGPHTVLTFTSWELLKEWASVHWPVE